MLIFSFQPDDSAIYAPEPLLDGATPGTIDYTKLGAIKRGDEGSITYVRPIAKVDPLE